MRLCLLLCLLGVASAHAETLSIENGALEVRYDTAAHRFAIQAAGREVLADGLLHLGGDNAQVAAVTDQTFGPGQSIQVGDSALMLFPSLPFVLIRGDIRHSQAAAQDYNRVPLASAAVMLQGELKTMGTGGLLAPERNTGSYAWLAVAEPQSRNGIVAGWLTHDRGSGVVFSPSENGRLRIAAQVDYGRLRVKPGAAAQTETFALGYFADTRLGLEAWADAIAKHYAIKLPRQPAGFCTWYTEQHSGACNETALAALAACAAKQLKPFGFEFVQIDDTWQAGVSKNGPKRDFLRAKPDGPYPSGMKAAADNITQLGLTPGIWFMPFAGTSYDPFFEPHQDWFYQGPDGKPFEAKWGGTCLDLSVPGARDHVRKVVERLAHEWGYRVFKMDGLWTGTGTRLMYVNNGYAWDEMGEAAPADPDKTQIEVYRDGLKLVRDAAGPDVYRLGCCVSQNMRSLGGSFGLVDAMRIGPDTGAGHIGAPHASRNYFLQGRVWHNDPDCVSVRTGTPLDQARVNASFTAVTGDLFYNSDWIPNLPPERLDILKRTIPAHGLPARPVDYFENDPARIWHLVGKGRDIVALFNWGKTPTTITCAVDRIGLPVAEQYVAFDFWGNKFLAPIRGEITAELPAASCLVLAVRPVADHPQLLSTSRHVTQGIVDVLEEKWDPVTRTLSGVSRVVARDPYELRVVVPAGETSWRAVAPATQDGPHVRLVTNSETSADLKWEIKFEPDRVEPAVPSGEAAPPP